MLWRRNLLFSGLRCPSCPSKNSIFYTDLQKNFKGCLFVLESGMAIDNFKLFFCHSTILPLNMCTCNKHVSTPILRLNSGFIVCIDLSEIAKIENGTLGGPVAKLSKAHQLQEKLNESLEIPSTSSMPALTIFL